MGACCEFVVGFDCCALISWMLDILFSFVLVCLIGGLIVCLVCLIDCFVLSVCLFVVLRLL